MSALDRSALAADLHRRVFAPGHAAPRVIGAEVELIPVEAASGRRCPIEPAPPGDDAPPATLPFLRRYGGALGWRESRTSKGSPRFTTPDGEITYEPGGQLEFSAAPADSAGSLLGALQRIVPPLRSAAASDGIVLLASGIDPFNDVADAPLLLGGPRYARMADYLAQRGPAGARMMRQTAAFQISLDIDASPDRWVAWRVLNAMAPYAVAIFANSPVYRRASAGAVSARAEAWRTLDPLRTGLPYDARDPVGRYLEFALRAPAILLPAVDGEHASMGRWLSSGIGRDDWEEHLSTLFPEVRPGGRFELRSPDAIAPDWYAAPLVLAAGIVYDPWALREADDLLGEPDEALLERAGRVGLGDPAIAGTARSLVDIALRGATGGFFSPDSLEEAAAFFDRYTRRARAPADDVADPGRPVSGITLAGVSPH